MTRLFLAAGVAALAIATPLAAKPPGGGGGGGNPHGGGGGGQPAAAQGGGGGHGHGEGGGGGAPAVMNYGGGSHGHGGGGGGAPAIMNYGGGGHGHGGGGGGAPMMMGGGSHGHGGGGGFAAPQQQRFERQQARGPQMHMERQQAHQQMRVERQQPRQEARNFERQQARGFERQQSQQQARGFERHQAREQAQANHGLQVQQQVINPQFAGGEPLNGKQARFAERQFVQNVDPVSYRTLTYANDVAVVPAYQVQRFVGAPLSQVTQVIGLSALPTSIQYLYPDTPDYYYQYGDGYLYQVNRGTSLIDALIPLLAGGYLPGQYLPQPYMASYVPSYYGLNSFYPDYGQLCNRYANGVVYQVDCVTGYVENVIPMYAGGYGVGQILPSAYSYYNVPMQYRTMYYDTPDYGYWYSPGAIYQYDQRSSLITSVAALMAPGFTVGQPLPLGYDAYNVPYDYRATYYDTPNAWYRYNNGYIYQVDPVTQIVTAVVASLLT